MDYIYVLIYGSDWDDSTIILSLEEAIQASINYPYDRVEIFSKKPNQTCYTPTYNYYENGKYMKYS